MGNFQSSSQNDFLNLVNNISQDVANSTFQTEQSGCISTQSIKFTTGPGVEIDCGIEIDQTAKSICNVTTTQSAQQSGTVSSQVSNSITADLTNKQKSTQGFLAAAVSAQVNTQTISQDIQNNISNAINNQVFQNCAASNYVNQNQEVYIGAGDLVKCPPGGGSFTLSQDSLLKSAVTCGQDAINKAITSASSVNTVLDQMTSEQVSSQGLDLSFLIVLLALPFLAAGKGVSSVTTVPKDSKGNAQWGVYGLHVGILGAIVMVIIGAVTSVLA
jgi:hypothetical protein